jgi:hypothetical protein
MLVLHFGSVSWIWFFNIGLLVFHWEIEFKRDNLFSIRVWDVVAFHWMVFHSDCFSWDGFFDGFHSDGFFVRIIGGFSIGCWIAFT